MPGVIEDLKTGLNKPIEGGSMELNDREKALIKECLVTVAKATNVGVEQMKELLALADKMVVAQEKPVV